MALDHPEEQEDNKRVKRWYQHMGHLLEIRLIK